MDMQHASTWIVPRPIRSGLYVPSSRFTAVGLRGLGMTDSQNVK